jgi:hypothetical protein
VVTHAFGRSYLVVLLLAVGTTQAAAQAIAQVPSRSLVPATFPKWDVSGSLGLLNVALDRDRRLQPWRGDWDHKFEYRADAGRYWTTHLKTELTVGTSNRSQDTEVETLPPGGPSSPIYAYTNVERRTTMLGPSFIWQFGENAFVHPYVGGGLQVWILQQHRLRTPDIYRYGGLGPPVPPLDERSTTVVGRPFVSAGFKSYISRSVFVRTEARAAFSSRGTRQVSMLAGIGVDF